MPARAKTCKSKVETSREMHRRVSSSAARKMLTLVLLAQSASAFTVVGRTAGRSE